MGPIADNVNVTPSGGTPIATDDVGGVQFQKNKIDLGGDGVSSPLVRGKQTEANSIPVTLASDENGIYTEGAVDTTISGQAVLWEDSGDTLRAASVAKPFPIQIADALGKQATVRDLAANDALNVAIVDGAGGHVTSFGGTGGTSSSDDADFTQLTTPGTPAMGVYESTATSVTDGDMGIVGINQSRHVRIEVASSTLDVSHDAADVGQPVKVGSQARSSFPTAVANADRANAVSDLFGRQLSTQIPGEMFIWKQVEATTAQTGTTIWDPAAGKRIAVTGYQVGTGGTTAGLVTIWFGANADVTFTQGTDQVLFRGSLTPTSTGTPGVISNLATPVFCTTPDFELHYTTSAAITVYITVYGYEW